MTNPQQTEGLTAERPLRYEYAKGETLIDMRLNISLDMVNTGDCRLIWANEGDLTMLDLPAPSPPAQEAVAFVAPGTMRTLLDMQRLGGIDARDIRVFHRKTDVMSEPLYTSPPDQSSLIKVLTEALEAAHTQLTNLGGDTRKIILVDSSVSHDEIQAAVLDQVESALSMAKEGNHEPK